LIREASEFLKKKRKEEFVVYEKGYERTGGQSTLA